MTTDRVPPSLREHIAKLIEVVRMPNIEHVADEHNAAVKALRALSTHPLLDVEPVAPDAQEVLRESCSGGAWRDVLAERKRQIEKEGWSAAHDDAHKPGELATAGYHYAANAAVCLGIQPGGLHIFDNWPWHPTWFKPTTPRRDLVKAGALILAEIERIDRAAQALRTGAARAPSEAER